MITDEPPIEINKELLQGLKIQRVFKDFLKDINALDFTPDGRFLVACDDSVLNVIDIVNMKKIRTLYDITQEIDLVKFTGDQYHVLCVTKNEPYEIIHWALIENQTLKRFIGHTNKIYHLDLCKQIFVTCSLDGTFRLWNLDSQNQTCDGLLDFNNKQTVFTAALDPSCSVFAITYFESSSDITNNWIYLYRIDRYQDGAFKSKKISIPQIKYLKFSPNNKYLLCGNIDGSINIMDAYLLNTICEIQQHADRLAVEVSFTPDTQFVISGSQQGVIYVYSISNPPQLIAKLEGHRRKCSLVRFSPSYSVMVSGCRNLVVWTPSQILL